MTRLCFEIHFGGGAGLKYKISKYQKENKLAYVNIAVIIYLIMDNWFDLEYSSTSHKILFTHELPSRFNLKNKCTFCVNYLRGYV